MEVKLEGKFEGIPKMYKTGEVIPNLTIEVVQLPPNLDIHPHKPFQMGGRLSPFVIHVCLKVGDEGFNFQGTTKRHTESLGEIFVPYDDFPGGKLAAQIDVGSITFKCELDFKQKDLKSAESEAVRFVNQFHWPFKGRS